MTRAAPRESASIPAAAELLSGWIGLDVETIGPASIGRAVRSRMEALGLDDPADAVARARLDAAERDRLVEEVVVAESWFFRDPQVFAFVSRFVTARAALPNAQPLRILSAPCAGGEEPYSMAMALLESGLPADRFAIDAIDVSRDALERARQGRYSANAFRNADVSFRERWFRHEGQASVLDDAVRRQVRFRWANLLDDSFVAEALPPDSTPFDVVFCRNLLIYLTPEARGRVERALERLVAPDGLLVLGAAEPPILKGDWIPAGDSSVFAMRRGVRAVPASAPTAVIAPARAAREPRRPTRREPAPVTAATAAAGTTTPPAASDALPSLDEVLREAGALANARRFAEAIARCEAHARHAGPSAQLFFLLGMLHQSAGDLDRAEGCFHKTLYLDAGHDEALLALALVAAQRGDAPMAEHYRQSAARIHARKGST